MNHRTCPRCHHDVTAHTSYGCTQRCPCMEHFGIVDIVDPDDGGLAAGIFAPDAQPYANALLSMPTAYCPTARELDASIREYRRLMKGAA